MGTSALALWCAAICLCAALIRSEKTCGELGFTGLALCSDCDALMEIVKDEELGSDCRKCCAQETDDAMSKLTYAGAVLEVCMRKIMFYPNVQSFIDDKLNSFPLVNLQYRYGASPKLHLRDEDGNVKESIRIDNWKTEHIESFLKEKVKPASEKDV